MPTQVPAIPSSLAGLRLCLSGNPHVAWPDGRMTALADVDAALLAWLALEGATSRGRLATLLWPDSALAAARTTLRQRLFQLKKVLGCELISGQATLALAPDVTHDLHDSRHLLNNAGAGIGGEFGHWLAQQRERRSQGASQSLVDQIDQAQATGDLAGALRFARELLALESLSEQAHRYVMRLHYLAGDRAAALLAFDLCERRLKDEVGTRPSPDTLALLATIEQAVVTPLTTSSPVPTSLLRPPRLIGRDNELAALAQAWQGGQVVAVSAEAGMGKSRLLQTFAESHPGTVHVAARPGDAAVPFATLARLMRAVMAQAQSVEALMAPAIRQQVARVLPEWQLDVPQVPGDTQRLGLERAIRTVLQSNAALAGLLVDDLHFADEASLDMLTSLMDDEGALQSPNSLRWVIAHRPVEGRTPLAMLQDALAEQARLNPLPLQPLSPAALAELVDSLALPDLRGAGLAQALWQRTGGNPLFVLETLKQAWVEHRLDDLAQAAKLPRPVSVGRLIERRIGQLSHPALALARVASIAGVDFQVALAERVLGVSAMQLADAQNELEAAQVLRGNAFAHDLVFEAVYASVPATIAAHTHAQVADWLEQHGGEPARIAGHWMAAQQGARAIPWLGQSAEAAQRALRTKEAICFLDTKSRIEAENGLTEAAFETLLQAAKIFVDVDLSTEASMVYCDRLDAVAHNPSQQVKALLHRAFMQAQMCNFEQTEQLAISALRLAESLGDVALIVAARRLVGTNCFASERFPEALLHFEACCLWYDAHGSDEERSAIHSDLASLYDNMGRLDDALPHHHWAINLARDLGDLSAASGACGGFACNRLDAGDIIAADHSLQQGQQMLVAYDEFGGHGGQLQLLRALTLSHLGRFGQALTQAELGLDSSRQYQPARLEFAQLRLASVWGQLAQWSRLMQLLAVVQVEDDTLSAARVLRARLAWQAAQALGNNLPVARQGLVDELARLDPVGRPDLRLPLVLDLALAPGALDPLPQIEAARHEAQRIGHLGLVLAAQVCAAAVEPDPTQARQAALVALALAAQGRQTVALLPAALWLHCGRALLVAGDDRHANEVLTQGRDWLRKTVDEQVPVSFRDSFLNRQPVHRELLALASRHLS
jgi:DNA-binding SARP family transcriptional activator/tetratricopeptide (TPR) repeat protein